MKTYNENEIRAILKEQGYKFAALRDIEGKTIVPYNTLKSKVTATDKVNEAFKRLKNLSDGVYTFCFLNNQGRNVRPDEYGYVKGNVMMDESGKAQGVQIINLPTKSQHPADAVLSYAQVLELKTELVTVRMERDNALKQIAQLEKDVAELEAELDAANAKKGEGLGEGQPDHWIKTLSENALPVLDRYFGLKEKDIELRMQQANRKPQAYQQPKQRKSPVVLPEIGSPKWDEWLTKAESYTDEQFEKFKSWLKGKSQAHYENLIAEFESEEEAGEGEEFDENE